MVNAEKSAAGARSGGRVWKALFGRVRVGGWIVFRGGSASRYEWVVCRFVMLGNFPLLNSAHSDMEFTTT